MRYMMLFLASIPFLNNDCGKEKNETPVCVQQKIEEIKKEPKWNPPAEVNEYLYFDKKVYLFTSNCCDQYIMLYDGSCNYICAPSGGIAGSGDRKCTDFYTAAKHIRLVWKDGR